MLSFYRHLPFVKILSFFLFLGFLQSCRQECETTIEGSLRPEPKDSELTESRGSMSNSLPSIIEKESNSKSHLSSYSTQSSSVLDVSEKDQTSIVKNTIAQPRKPLSIQWGQSETAISEDTSELKVVQVNSVKFTEAQVVYPQSLSNGAESSSKAIMKEYKISGTSTPLIQSSFPQQFSGSARGNLTKPSKRSSTFFKQEAAQQQ